MGVEKILSTLKDMEPLARECEDLFGTGTGSVFLDLQNYFLNYHNRSMAKIEEIFKKAEKNSREASDKVTHVLNEVDSEDDAAIIETASQIYNVNFLTIKGCAAEIQPFLPPLKLQGTFHEKITAEYNTKKVKIDEAIDAFGKVMSMEGLAASVEEDKDEPVEKTPDADYIPVRDNTRQNLGRDIEALDVIMYINEKVSRDSEASGKFFEWITHLATYLKEMLSTGEVTEADIKVDQSLCKSMENIKITHIDENYPLIAILEYVSDFARLVSDTRNAINANASSMEYEKNAFVEQRRETLMYLKQVALMFEDPSLEEVVNVKSNLFYLWNKWKKFYAKYPCGKVHGVINLFNSLGERLMVFQKEINARIDGLV